ERFRAPENYGKSRYLKHSYEIPMDEKESQLRLLEKERLSDYEIERIMEKRRRIERQCW
ncbi:24597_t:CDS:1, partial [Gigaspora rosea]